MIAQSNTQEYCEEDYEFLAIAQGAAISSRDPRTRVGAVITDYEGRLLSVGHNGFGRNSQNGSAVAEDERMQCRDTKLKMVVHAEKRAYLNSVKSYGFQHNLTVYTYPFMPCSQCAGFLIETSCVDNVITLRTERKDHGFTLARNQFEECGIKLVEYDYNHFFKWLATKQEEEYSQHVRNIARTDTQEGHEGASQ